MSSLHLILASASPRRQQLLQQLGLRFITLRQDIDESLAAGEAPSHYVQRMAREKADSALRSFSSDPNAVIIAADTVVVFRQQVLAKPVNQSDAQRMLLMLADNEHRVLSAVTVATTLRSQSALSESRVSFRAISALEAQRYWHTGEPVGKAGAYGIQGYAAVFVNRLAGSYSGVMGLPLFETAQLLSSFGIDCLPAKMEH